MKRMISAVLASVMILGVSACGGQTNENQPNAVGKKKEWVQLVPSTLLSAEEVQSIAGFVPVAEEKLTRQHSAVTYQSEQIGAQDPVILDVYQYNGRKSVALVRREYEEWKEKRPQAKEIDGFTDTDAFLAYPSLHLYRDGIHVVITAGSGADDAQAELLQKLAVPVLEHLGEFLEAHPTEADLAADLNEA